MFSWHVPYFMIKLTAYMDHLIVSHLDGLLVERSYREPRYASTLYLVLNTSRFGSAIDASIV